MQQNLFKGYVVRAGVVAGLVGAVVLLVSLVPIVGWCIGLFTWVIFVGAGVLAVLWGKGQGVLLTTQQNAIDGAVAGGLAGILALLVKYVVDIGLSLVGTVLSSSVGSAVTGLIQAIVFGLVAVIVGVLVAAILGAIGGLIYGAITQSQKTV